MRSGPPDAWAHGVLIAHRLSLVYNADVVAVMDEGRVVETGEPGACWDGAGIPPASEAYGPDEP